MIEDKIIRMQKLIDRILDASVDGVEYELMSGRPYVFRSTVRAELAKYHREMVAEAGEMLKIGSSMRRKP